MRLKTRLFLGLRMSFLLSKNISKHQNEGLVENRQAILESATRLFGSTGFYATTTLEIAAEADVTEPLIYYHFKGKDELFTHSFDLN